MYLKRRKSDLSLASDAIANKSRKKTSEGHEMCLFHTVRVAQEHSNLTVRVVLLKALV